MNNNAKQITRNYIQYLKAPPSRVFPLLCPVREYEWIYYWKCELIYSKSGYAEKGCIFKLTFRAKIRVPGLSPGTCQIKK